MLDGPGRGDVLSVPAGRVTVGSGSASVLRLTDPSVSAVHAELASSPDGSFWIRDLTGSGGTLVNGEPVAKSRLVDGTFVKLGATELCVREKGKSGPYGTAIQRSPTGAQAAAGIDSSAVRRPDPRSNLAPKRPTDPGARVSPSGTYLRPKGRGPADGSVLPPDAVIAGRYRVVDKLAEGGMGEVYKVEHIELSKPFAMKVMKSQFGADLDFVERFKREAVAAGRIGQQNIVDVSDFGRTEDGRFFFAMEFLNGPTVAQVLKNEGALPPGRALFILAQMCRALRAAHAQGIVHRDLKPENVILLERDGQPDFVKVVDFGVAKVTTSQSSGMTSAGMVVGTPQYMSPEQAAGLPLDARTDIYSLGLIAYELLSGRPPFEEATPSLIMAAHIYKPAPRLYPPPHVDGLQTALDALVMKMLAKPPEGRPQSIQDVLAALDECWSQLDPSGVGFATIRTGGTARLPYPTPRPSGSRLPAVPALTPAPASVSAAVPAAPAAPRSRAPWFALGGGILAAAGAAAFFAWPGKQPAPAPVPPLPPIVEAAPAPAPAPPPKTEPDKPPQVKLSLVTDPPNAEVYDGASLLGRTPLMLDWPAGKRAELKFALDGFLPQARSVQPSRDTPLFVKLNRPAQKVRHKAEPAHSSDDDIKDNPFK